jgi:hypothetical protein
MPDLFLSSCGDSDSSLCLESLLELSDSSLIVDTLVDGLTEQEKEVAARSSYSYSKLADASASAAGTRVRTRFLDNAREKAAADMAARHLIAEEGNFNRSLSNLKKSIAYREERNISEYSTSLNQEKRELIESYMEDGHLFVRGYDVEDRAVVHIIAKNAPDGKKKGCLESCCYAIEKAIACTEREGLGESEFVVSVDFSGVEEWRGEEVFQQLFDVLKQCYSSQLHHVFLFNAPPMVRAKWAFLKLVDTVAKQKVQFISYKERHELYQVFDASQSMRYQRHDGEMVDPVDMEAFFQLPFDYAYGEK